MGQKVHPIGIRLGIVKKHTSVWYAEGEEYANNLLVDLEVREFVKARLANASVARVDIERPAKTAKVSIYTARPGIVIGKKGEDVEKLRATLTKRMGIPVQINIEEIRKPDLEAQLVADGVAQQLERRVMFRRAMKRAEIARSEWYREGRVPLHTLRADIDYATSEASTTYGIIGVKVWIFKGEILDLDNAIVPKQVQSGN